MNVKLLIFKIELYSQFLSVICQVLIIKFENLLIELFFAISIKIFNKVIHWVWNWDLITKIIILEGFLDNNAVIFLFLNHAINKDFF